MYHVSWCWE